MGLGSRSWLKIGFAYNIQRSYPFRFFTGSITALPLILFVVFTVFNVAANGYGMESIVVADPNTTISRRQWFHNPIFTFGDDKLTPKCSRNNLAVGVPFITTNSGFQYVLTNIFDNHNISRTSMPYLNNTLEHCSITRVLIDLAKSSGQSKPGGTRQWWSWNRNVAHLTGDCHVATLEGRFRLVYMTTAFDTQSRIAPFNADPDPKTDARAWWGRGMLRSYWQGIKVSMAQGNGSDTPFNAVTGFFAYNIKNPVTSLEKADAFKAGYTLVSTDGSITHPGMTKVSGDQFFNNNSFLWSRQMTEGLSFTKVFYSLILTDLGDSKEPNYFLSNNSLRVALQSPYNFNRGANRTSKLCVKQDNGQKELACSLLAPAGSGLRGRTTMEEAYDTFRDHTGRLGTGSVTIYNQYTCSIPLRRPIAAIIWTILVANLVLLGLAYNISMFVATSVVSHREYPTAMHCEGCRSIMNSSTQVAVESDMCHPSTPIPVMDCDNGDMRRLIDDTATHRPTSISRDNRASNRFLGRPVRPLHTV